MISIIVCSANDNLYQDFCENCRQTIGLEFEFIRVDNKDGRYSLCEAYNWGASNAKFPFFCFAHEDILIHTPNWGPMLVGYFETLPTLGLIGVAGSKVKTRMVSNWWLPRIHGHEPKRGKLFQHFRDKPARITEWWEGDGDLDEVVTVDGVFMFTRKKIWQENQFDSQLLTRFHGYDFDFSMQVGRQWKVCATRAIQIEHLSPGSFDLDWVTSTLAAHEKWKAHLPKSVHPDIPPQRLGFLDRQLLNDCYAKLARLGTSWTVGLPLLYRAISLVHSWYSLNGLLWRIRILATWIKSSVTRKLRLAVTTRG